MNSNAPEWIAPTPNKSINCKSVGRQHKSTVNIPGAARRPGYSNLSDAEFENAPRAYKNTVERGSRVILGADSNISRTNVLNSSSNVRNNSNFINFNSNSNDFREGLTSVQGQLEL